MSTAPAPAAVPAPAAANAPPAVAAQAPPQAPQQALQQPLPPTFALNPAQAVQGLFDFTDTAGAKIYKAATSALNVVFSGTVTTLRPFLRELNRRSVEYGAQDLLNIPKIGTPGHTNSLITQSRLVSFEDIKAHANSFMGLQVRGTQLNHMFVNCLFNSMNSEGLRNLEQSGYCYQVNDEDCFPLMVKTMIQLCEVDTQATSFLVRHDMAKLTPKIQELKYDIKEFNMHVNNLIERLETAGETSQDLFIQVFNAYKVCPDEDFQQELKAQARLYKEGKINRSTGDLMAWGLQIFIELMEADTYGKPSKSDQEIMALTAKLEETNENNNKLKKQLTQITQGQGEKREKRGDKKGKKDKKSDLPNWAIPTNEQSAGPKQHKGKDFFYCFEHKKWGRHKTDDCQVRKARLEEEESSSNEESSSAAPTAAATLLSMLANAE